MGPLYDLSAAMAATMTGTGAIAWGVFGTLLLGYWIMSLKTDRHHRWRRDRTNLSRMPVWRCKRCGMIASTGAKRSGSVCGA